MRVKYLGGADTFQTEEGGKLYHVGDTFEMPEEVVAHMSRNGHSFGLAKDKEPGVLQPQADNTVAKPDAEAEKS